MTSFAPLTAYIKINMVCKDMEDIFKCFLCNQNQHDHADSDVAADRK